MTRQASIPETTTIRKTAAHSKVGCRESCCTSRNTAKRRRVGFTLVELLVVIAIIGILLAIAIPAIQAVRESARRVHCGNNLRQLAVGIWNYQAAQREFPSKYPGYSFHAAILPFLDEGNLADQFDYDLSTWHPVNRNAADTQVPLFLCPSDGVAAELSETISVTNYVGNYGYAYQVYGDNGIFGNEGTIRPADVPDGLGHTAMLSECLAGDLESGDRRRLIYNAPRLQRPEQLEEFIAACRAVLRNPNGPGSWLRGRPWHNSSYNLTHYNHMLLPNEGCCYNGQNVSRGAYSPMCNHRSGVNLVFADGRLQFVSSSIDYGVWVSLGTRNGVSVN